MSQTARRDRFARNRNIRYDRSMVLFCNRQFEDWRCAWTGRR